MSKWLVGLLLLAFPCLVGAAQVSAQWDYPAGTSITGFKLYCSTTSGTWPGTPTATTPAATKTANITFTGRTYCVVRAYDAVGESGDSNILALLEAPGNLRTASQSVQFDPATEKVAMTARIISLTTGQVLSEVTSEAGADGVYVLDLGRLMLASQRLASRVQ